MSEENTPVEKQETTLSEAERTAVAEIVNATLGNTVETKAKKVYTELAAANRADVGDELCPTWMKHSARFLTAIAKNKNGDKGEAVAMAEKFMKDRAAINSNAKAYEAQEALRIIRSSKLNKQQQMRIQSTINNDDGGFLLPKPFLAEIFVTLEEFGVARRTFRGIPMSNKTLDLKDVAQKPVVTWEDENAKISETQIKFGEKQLVARKLAALLPWTLEFQEDEVFGFVSLASQLFGEELAKKEDSAGFTGGGSLDTANGGYTGMLNLVNAVVYNLGGSNGSGKTSVEDLTEDDLNKAIYSISQAKRRGARFFMHDSIQGVVERLKDNEGRPIYRMPGDGTGPGNIYGYPVEWVDVMPSIADDDEGLRFIAFGNPANMLFGNRRGVTFDIGREGTIINSADATTAYSAFQQDGAILRVTQRIGFETPLDQNFVVIKTAAS